MIRCFCLFSAGIGVATGDGGRSSGRCGGPAGVARPPCPATGDGGGGEGRAIRRWANRGGEGGVAVAAEDWRPEVSPVARLCAVEVCSRTAAVCRLGAGEEGTATEDSRMPAVGRLGAAVVCLAAEVATCCAAGRARAGDDGAQV